MTDTADEPIIASRVEAWLCAGWWLLFVAACSLASSSDRSRPGRSSCSPCLTLPLSSDVSGRRLGTNSNKLLRHWMGYRAQVQAWRVIFGGKSTKVGAAVARPT